MNCVKKNRENWFSDSKWIAMSDGYTLDDYYDDSPCFRKVFSLDKNVKSAKIAVCGLGLYQFYINGERPTNNVLMPLFTDYNKRVLYDVIDITDFVKEGKNCLGFVLGNGFYNVQNDPCWNFSTAPWRCIPKLVFDLLVEYEDGAKCRVVSDNSVRVTKGPITFNCIRTGETFDARLYKKDWVDIDFDDSGWIFAATTCPSGILCENEAPAIKECEVFKPISITNLKNGHIVYDIGQNIAGYVRLSGKGTEGTTVVFRYGELLDDDGNLYTDNVAHHYNGEFQTDRYIFGKDEVINWSPLFVYHGFRYIEVEIIGEAEIEICGVAIRTAFDKIGTFECSDAHLNKLHNASMWSDRNNFVGIPTDCPQREKNGWTSEAWLAAERYFFYFDAAKAYQKWLYDFCDAQLPNGKLPCIIPTSGWGYKWGNGVTYDCTLIYIAYITYCENGDISYLSQFYPAIKASVKYLENFLRDDYTVNISLEDWLSTDIEHPCPKEITATSYFYSICIIMSKIAHLLSDTETEEYYANLAETVKKHFNENFVDSKTGKIGDSSHNVQTAQCVPLYHGIVSDENREIVAKYLKDILKDTDGHITTGTYGTKCILEILSSYGYLKEAYEMVNKKDYPGWGFMLENGATALWEEWGGGKVVPWSGSHNHNALCSVGEWLYRHVAGMRPEKDSVAYDKIIFAPALELPIDSAACSHNTIRGDASISWHKDGNNATINICVPTGSTARLIVPNGYELFDSSDLTFDSGEYTITLKKI